MHVVRACQGRHAVAGMQRGAAPNSAGLLQMRTPSCPIAALMPLRMHTQATTATCTGRLPCRAPGRQR